MPEKKIQVKILVACHKADPYIRQDDIYMPIQVGKTLHPELDLGFQCDNVGDNISEKNASYCELTAIYWAWKNLKDADYIGLCHYRRYFDFKTLGSSVRIIPGKEVKTTRDFIPKLSKLNSEEVILPKFWSCPNSIWKNFTNNVLAQDLYIVYKIIDKYYPKYTPSLEKYMLGNRRTGYNMFLMSWQNFDKYCTWLFDVLAKVEKSVKLSEYISYARLYGYLGEILLPVYCMTNNIGITTRRVAFCEGTASKLHTWGRRQIKNVMYNLSFLLSKIPIQKSLKNPYWELYLKLDNIII